MEQGFIDLRQNHGESGLGESFWPSFTDIMTVIVMIFILASTVLIVRNWELVAELQRTLEAERQAEAQAAAVEETNQTLSQQLAQVQSLLSDVRIQNLRLEEQNASQRDRLAAQEQQVLALRTEREQLSGEVDAAERQLALLGDQLAQSRTHNEELQNVAEQRQVRLDEIIAQLQALEQRHSATVAELGDVRQARANTVEQLASLQDEYATLEAKYQDLIRPARTAAGKQVAEVRYYRAGGQPRIQLRGPGEQGYSEVSSEAMDQRLGALKEQYGQDLYVKVIIPSDSGLSYNEAWDFTRTVLNRYDYYYQK